MTGCLILVKCIISSIRLKSYLKSGNININTGMVFVIVITSKMNRFLVTLLANRVGLKPKMMKHGSLFSWLFRSRKLGIIELYMREKRRHVLTGYQGETLTRPAVPVRDARGPLQVTTNSVRVNSLTN